MERTLCQCIFPSETEEEVVVIEGTQAGTAMRVYLQTGHEGYVRLQQLAYDAGLGWYVQKSMVIPGELLQTLIPHLRKADCLIPRRNEPTPFAAPFMRLTPASQQRNPQRRGA